MKILFLSNLYPPNVVGGYERLCFEIANGLSSHGWQIFVLTSDFGKQVQDFSGQTVERTLKLLANEKDIYQPATYSPEQRAKISKNNIEILKQTAQQVQPDVIFVWNLYFFDSLFLDVLKQLNRPIVYLITDNWLIALLNPPYIQEFFANTIKKNSLGKLLYRKVRRWFYDFRKPRFYLSGHAIFASCFMRELYNDARFSFTSSSVIYHGVRLVDNPNHSFLDRTKLVNFNELNLLIAGRIVELKGVHTAIDALPLIKQALPEIKVRLTILGDDRDQEYLERINNQINHISDIDQVEVIFSKPVPEKELINLFQHHDIFLFPSLYEPFSLTLIHALGAGIPTVASDSGGNPEIVHHLKTGLVFPKGNEKKLAESVVQLARNSDLRITISKNARCIARDYNFERMLGDIEGLLKNLA